MVSGLASSSFNYKSAASWVGPVQSTIDPGTGKARTAPYNLGYQDGAKLTSSQPANPAQLMQFGGSQGYGNNICANTPASIEYMDQATGLHRSGTTGEMLPLKLNIDDVKHPYMEVETDSTGLRATELPKKTTIIKETPY